MTAELHIPGFPGYYATAEGDIISRRRGGIRRLKKTIESHGYQVVTLYTPRGFDGKSQPVRRYVHQLVLEAHGFIKTQEHDQVRHLNGNKVDNRINNLRWSCQSSNYEDRVEHGTDMVAIRQRLDWDRTTGSRSGSYPVK